MIEPTAETTPEGIIRISAPLIAWRRTGHYREDAGPDDEVRTLPAWPEETDGLLAELRRAAV